MVRPSFPMETDCLILIDETKISIFGVSAKFISAVEKADLRPRETHDLSSLKTICSTGSPLSKENFEFSYQHIKEDFCLASISGGTDIIGCFALANPTLPVYPGELQVRSLGLNVQIYDDEANSLVEQAGELVCSNPFPSMPIYFWNDPEGIKYRDSYFSVYENVWRHGDWAKVTDRGGMVIYGRSDATLNPGGVRIGTSEIYRQVEAFEEVLESVVIGQSWCGDERVVLFVVLREGLTLTEEFKKSVNKQIRNACSPRHVPAKIIQIAGIPRTISGKISELAVKSIVHGRELKNREALANPESLEYFINLAELQES